MQCIAVNVAEGQFRVWTGQHKVTLLLDGAPLAYQGYKTTANDALQVSEVKPSTQQKQSKQIITILKLVMCASIKWHSTMISLETKRTAELFIILL